MDMIEKMARAIAVNLGVDPDMWHFTLSEAPLLGWQQFEGTVKDVLEALRAPTEAMSDAGSHAYHEARGWRGDPVATSECNTVFQAMIDAARGQ